MSTKKTIATVATLAFSSGVGADRLLNPPPERAAVIQQIRFLDEGPKVPSRYAFTIETSVDGATNQRELVCGNQGSVDSWGNAPFENTNAKEACEALAKFAPPVQRLIGNMAAELTAPLPKSP